jgi:tRNA(fMet)-specific endonuclease VapC
MIVDTNALSAFADGDLKVRDLLGASTGPFLPVIVLGEYHFGLLQSREREKRLAWLESLITYWPVLDISRATAQSYSHVRQLLKRNATPIPSNDTWIAALALEHELPILSSDSHFDVIPGVKRISF